MALPLPPWFGPRTVLEEVEQLVLNDNNNNAAQGWPWQEIKESLMQTHQQNQQELPPGFNAALRNTLARLRDRNHLKTGVGGPQCYTLSNTPPYFPPWFGKDEVLHAVGVLDVNNDGGSTWAQIRDSLLEAHQPQHPPDFVRLLRAMLSVLRQRGHLRVIGHQHYTRQEAPAPAEHNPVDIPDHLWFYYLGYNLGVDHGLDGCGAINEAMQAPKKKRRRSHA